ncbi:STP1 protein [Plasmodium ovale]|uniref:STP1 protein n=1 Tax=Plasmodium ovale TaxID=36330 RepID=A0A1C3KKQ3_PLAOA|nr:STP1 protein [Plasmodium ovale]
MAGDSGYTALTHYIDINFFKAMIKNDIKKLIHTYGHKNCGLRQEELCEELNKYIYKKKTLELSFMDEKGKTKWNSEWNKQRSKYFDKLYKEEGFINMCFPKTYPEKNQRLNQSLSKHIEFCKKRDDWKEVLEKNSEYSECVKYNSWIDTQRRSFTREFLKNVQDYKFRNVKKYFSTKEYPGGHDPSDTYLNSKLNCRLYNHPSKTNRQKPVDKAPTKNLHPPEPPDVRKESEGNDGKSMQDGDGGTEKVKSDVKILPKTEPSTSDTQTSSITNTKDNGTDNGQNADLKAKGTDHPSKDQVDAGKPAEVTDAKAPSIQQLPEPPSSISLKDSLAAKVLDPRPPVIKDQGAVSDATPSTTSATSDTTHSIQNILAPPAPDFSLAQPQSPTVDKVTAQYSKETAPPDPVGKSPNQDALVTPALGPGLAPPQAAASNSSASETSSTTTISTIGSSLDKDPHFPTLSTQPIVTTSVDTTVTQTVASVSGPPTITDAVMGTTPITSIIRITSTTGESGEPNSKLKTIPDSQDENSAYSKSQNDALSPNTGAQFPDAPSSATSPNLNDNLLPVPSSRPSPGLHYGVSPAGPAPVLTASHVVTKPDGKKTITSKSIPKKSKDLTLVSSKSLPEGAQPSGEPSITSTKYPPLTTIIPTIIIILAAITLLFQLYKDLKRIFKKPEKPAYESPNITVHEWEGPNLLGQIVENDAYIKLLKTNRYKQEMQKRKKENKKTLIEVHMEVLEEYKSDEWELHKGDFLEICLRGFINDENDFYSNFPNSKLIVNNIKNEKTIEDIQNHEILWNNWIEDHRNILEEWKKEDWFHILKNKWRNEEQIYKEKNHKLQENMLNEQETYSIVSQKDMWKQWISKQAALIDMFNKEDWFKSIAHAQNKEKDNYHINEYNNITVTNENQLKNEKVNHELGRSKNIIQKLMVQIHMMVLEECIKEDIIKHKELCIDNFIEDIHNENNYEEKRNMPQSDIDNFKVPEFEEIHTSKNK